MVNKKKEYKIPQWGLSDFNCFFLHNCLLWDLWNALNLKTRVSIVKTNLCLSEFYSPFCALLLRFRPGSMLFRAYIWANIAWFNSRGFGFESKSLLMAAILLPGRATSDDILCGSLWKSTCGTISSGLTSEISEDRKKTYDKRNPSYREVNLIR